MGQKAQAALHRARQWQRPRPWLVMLALLLWLGACAAPPTSLPPSTPTAAPRDPAAASSPVAPTVLASVPTPSPVSLTLRRPGITAFAFIDQARGWAADHTRLFATEDGGRSWRELAAFPTTVAVLDRVSASHGWALTESGLFVTADAGTSWAPVAVPALLVPTVDFADERQGWLSDAITLLVTEDGGQTWEPRTHPCGTISEIKDISVIGKDAGWLLCTGEPGAGHQSKAIYRTEDGGRTWMLVAEMGSDPATSALPIGDYAGDLFALDDQHAWLGIGRGEDGGQWATSDGGQTWVPTESNERGVLDQVQFLTPSHGYALSNPYQRPMGMVALLATEDGGRTWEQKFPLP